MTFTTENSAVPPAPSTTLTQQYESGGPYSADHAEASVAITRSALAATGPAVLGRLQGNKGPIEQIPLGAGLAFVDGALAATGGGGTGSGGAVASVNTRTGAVVITVADVGLSLVNNTADTAKPVSAAQAAADTAVASNASSALAGHTSNVTNPHATTAAQVGAPSGSGTSTGTNTGDQTNISGNAATVTTNANLTGPVTSAGNATAIAAGAITNAMLANAAVANLSGTNTGDNATNALYSGLVSNATHTGDATGATALVLATVNGNVGSFTNATVTVNAKGLITAVANGSAGVGDMVLATAQTVSGAKTYNAATLLLNNVAGTFASLFTNANTAARTYTLKDASGTVAFTSDITGTNSGTNTGDQTNIAGNAATVTTNANLTGPVTSTGNATAIAAGAITNAMLANAAVANLSGTNTGDNATNALYSGLVSATWATPGTIGLTAPNTGAFTTLSATGAATVNSITLSGNISAAAWTTSGVRFKGNPATLTDTTSTGTVAAAYTDSFGGNTIAASSTTTFTNYITAYFKDPIAGTNATMTSKWALGADSFRAGSTGQFSVTNAGVVTLPAGQAVNGVTLTNAGLATNFLTAAGTYAAASGGGAPGGSTLQLQYNNAGVVAGMSGTAWDDTNRSLVVTGATVTASKPVLDLAQTWNNAATVFKGAALNIVDTASAAGSNILSLQIGGVEKVVVTKRGSILSTAGSTNPSDVLYGYLQSGNTSTNGLNAAFGTADLVASGTTTLRASPRGVEIPLGLLYGFANIGVTLPDTSIGRNAAGVVEINNATLGAFRDLKLRNLIVDNVVNLKVFTVATLPSAATSGAGAEAYVTDALTPAYNTTVATGGAIKICVVSDGTNWKT